MTFPAKGTAVIAALLCAVAGCGDWSIDGDNGAHPERRLQVAIPRGATDISRTAYGTFPSVSFLMPQQDWRGYVGNYLPLDTLDHAPWQHPENVPAICTGSPAEFFAASEDFTTSHADVPDGFTAQRSVMVVEDCRPEMAYVSWSLYEPGARHRPDCTVTTEKNWCQLSDDDR